MKLRKFFQFLLNPNKKTKRLALLFVFFSLLFNTFLVYITGGIPSAFAHTMYLTTLIASIFFGPWVAFVVGVIGGILIGPVMSLEFMPGEGELWFNSLYRIIYFALMGLLVGIVLRYLKSQLERLHILNTHDALTGMPNINYYIEKRPANVLSNHMAITIQINNHEALILLIGNQAYGQVIKQLYESIKSLLPQEAIMVCVDERRFWIEVPYNEYYTLKDSLNRHLDKVNLNDGNIPLFFDYSIGASIPNASTSPMQRFRQSDAASMHAKNHVLKFVEYDQTFEQDQNSFKLLGELPKAIQDNDLFLLYQPVIDLKQDKCIGCEALIRWNRQGEVIPPKDFIILAEKTRIINQITYWVFNQIVRDYPTFQEQKLDLQISMNFSQRNLYEPRLVEYIIKKMQKSMIPTRAIELEITESTLMLNQRAAETFLNLFRAQGINIALDDFGNEYSSLAYLRDLPVEKIKIDRGFTMNIVSNQNTRSLVQAIIELAHNMGFKVVAEGIENEDILNVLLKMDCDYGQGYYYEKPMTKENPITWLSNRGEHHEKE
jgi:EAL domain-containing protein (putative c-di-GMP-specific phosphodiesterase class I)/GGDEF domain-containing protein